MPWSMDRDFVRSEKAKKEVHLPLQMGLNFLYYSIYFSAFTDWQNGFLHVY